MHSTEVEMKKGDYKGTAAVIGSGFGGLSLAIRLQAQGFRTVIFEKRDLPGGRAYVYKDKGFTFDAGPTVITAPDCLEELFTLASPQTGKKMSDYVELMPVLPFYRLMWEDGTHFDYSGDLDETLRQIRERNPRDAEGYQRFLKYSQAVFDEGYTKLAHVPFLDWWSMIRVSPELIRLEAFRSVYSVVSKYIEDPKLREAFSFHSLLVGGNPFKTSSIYTLIHYLERNWGVHFPRGGTGALVQGLVRLFTDIGGVIRLNSEVDEIIVEGGRATGVRTRSGEICRFDVVASNGDVMHTYRHLLRNAPLARPMERRLDKMSYSMSLFLIYFGTKKKYEHIAHHSVLFGPRYKGLLDDIFKHGNLADDFSLYLHAPTRSDPALAPEGCDAFYVLSPVPHLGNSEINWQTEAPRYVDRILSYLEERHMPGLRENIVTQRLFTPEDFRTELNAHQGSAFSIEPLLTQSAFFRAHNRDDRIAGLYLAGAGTHPGAGLPGVINSAKATAGVILGDCEAGTITASASASDGAPAYA